MRQKVLYVGLGLEGEALRRVVRDIEDELVLPSPEDPPGGRQSVEPVHLLLAELFLLLALVGLVGQQCVQQLRLDLRTVLVQVLDDEGVFVLVVLHEREELTV